MRQRLPIALATILATAIATSAFACLWDSDTLQMERLRFPGVLELITGKFVRHSRSYYEWRVQDREQKLTESPGDPALIDDLAVAYDKLGRQSEGIALLEESLAQHPDRYETLANLGTLLIHAGRFDEGLQFIDRAIEINPDAHFGREKYQKLLVEYVQQSELDAAGVLSSKRRNLHDDRPGGFTGFVIAARFGTEDWSQSGLSADEWSRQRDEEIQTSIKGVLGMMHFGNYRSPVLLEALGDLLIVGRPEENMTLLAARAYLRASQVTPNPTVAANYRQMAVDVLESHEDFGMHRDTPDLEKLEAQLAKELADAEDYFARIEHDEQRWIAAGADVDAQFAAVYYDSLDETLSEAERQVRSEPRDRPLTQEQWHRTLAATAVGLLCVAPVSLVVLLGAWWVFRRPPRSGS
jgi:tetratricopeptide (TPR) repeat protein